MAYKSKRGIPDAITRRELLADNPKQVDVAAAGKAYESHGMYSDALDCYLKANDPQALEALRAKAIDEDPWLLNRFALHGLVSEAQWLEAGEKAEAKGKLLHAAKAYRRAGKTERAEALQEKIDSFREEIQQPERGRWTPTAPQGEPQATEEEPTPAK
ncbi:MAG: hypothetical protein ACYTFT_03495 [Planctomycetota bacterium]|jgi:tetratricopeptide (TPR) repeat protein